MGYPFANVGWTDWIGTLTGMSSKKIGMSEIGVSFEPPYFGDEPSNPFVFLSVSWCSTQPLYDAMDRIKNANRTCQLMLGVADANAQTARLVQYSHSRSTYDDGSRASCLVAPSHSDVVRRYGFCPFYQHSMANQSVIPRKLTPEISISTWPLPWWPVICTLQCTIWQKGCSSLEITRLSLRMVLTWVWKRTSANGCV